MEKKVKTQQSNKENKSTDLRSGNLPPKGEMKNSPTNAVKKDQEVRSSAAEKKDAASLVKSTPKKDSASLVKSTPKKETGSRVKSTPKKDSGSGIKSTTKKTGSSSTATRKVLGSAGKKDSGSKK